jgi:hypothetical protein
MPAKAGIHDFSGGRRHIFATHTPVEPKVFWFFFSKKNFLLTAFIPK